MSVHDIRTTVATEVLWDLPIVDAVEKALDRLLYPDTHFEDTLSNMIHVSDLLLRSSAYIHQCLKISTKVKV